MFLRKSKLIYFSFSQLFKHGVHLGLQSTILHSSMLKYLLPFKHLKFTILNLHYTLVNLKLAVNLAIDIVSKRGVTLLINSSSSLDEFLFDFFSGLNQPVSRGL